ncbi:MAG TPA: rhodanese-like domain-containing protein [Trebonia sp.]|nr:rhodanese-like domain-containing protein [Trebonia sp.]
MSVTSALKGLFAKPYQTVSAAEAAVMAGDGALLLDVREPREWQAGHAPKARHIPLGQLAHRVRELPNGRAVITVCRSGARSARAAALLAGEGRQVSNLTGGMHAWARAGLPVVAKGGSPGRIA